MPRPRANARGDRHAVVAPASPFRRDEFDQGIDEIRSLGFIPGDADSVFARDRYVAGSRDARAAALRAAWRDGSIAGIVGVRGGYGSAQVLPLLDRDEIRRTPKPLIGYSDLTALLTFLTIGCGVIAFHGPMLAGRLGRGAAGYDVQSFTKAVCRPEPAGELTGSAVEPLRAGEAAGSLLLVSVTQILGCHGTTFW